MPNLELEVQMTIPAIARRSADPMVSAVTFAPNSLPSSDGSALTFSRARSPVPAITQRSTGCAASTNAESQ